MGGTFPQLFPFIMLASVVVGALVSRRYRGDLQLDTFNRFWLGMSAFTGAILTAKIPYLIPGLPGFQNAESFLLGGKTILFGMVGGYLGVELGKRSIGLTQKTGDTFVVPVATSIAIGRIACFCAGCCYGQPTDLPWGIVFPAVDDAARHPTQFYEFGFHLSAAFVFAWMIRRRLLKGQLIKLYFISYFGYRFVTEFIRPEERIAAGLTAYQFAALTFAALFAGLWWSDARKMKAAAG